MTYGVVPDHQCKSVYIDGQGDIFSLL
jgi:hypothetical protein